MSAKECVMGAKHDYNVRGHDPLYSFLYAR